MVWQERKELAKDLLTALFSTFSSLVLMVFKIPSQVTALKENTQCFLIIERFILKAPQEKTSQGFSRFEILYKNSEWHWSKTCSKWIYKSYWLPCWVAVSKKLWTAIIKVFLSDIQPAQFAGIQHWYRLLFLLGKCKEQVDEVFLFSGLMIWNHRCFEVSRLVLWIPLTFEML